MASPSPRWPTGVETLQAEELQSGVEDLAAGLFGFGCDLGCLHKVERVQDQYGADARPLVNAYFEHVQNMAFELAVAYPAALRSLTAAAR